MGKKCREKRAKRDAREATITPPPPPPEEEEKVCRAARLVLEGVRDASSLFKTYVLALCHRQKSVTGLTGWPSQRHSDKMKSIFNKVRVVTVLRSYSSSLA
jgi:hypothetical protein